ncbi:MAG: PHP domain-containing protein [Ignavibacteriae bacterium]|nr:PHP domain-containing protein [Ignavibacteriota bacterium]
MKKRADLHIHTIYSDGSQTPEEILKMAVKANLGAISITDHDSVDAYEQIKSVKKNYNLEILTGIEFSCYENEQEIHILGYNLDIHDKDLLHHLDTFKKAREVRANRIVAKLKKVNVELSFDEIKIKAGVAPITRPHIASALIEKGYVNSQREAFYLYLSEGKPGYESKFYFTIQDAIKLINNCGGIAVLAHPGDTFSQEMIYNLIEYGIDGIEVVHPMHNNTMEKYFTQIANQYWLITTGGSDYHGSRDYDGSNFGKYTVPVSVLDTIFKRNQKRLF